MLQVIRIPDKTGMTPVMVAAIRGYPSIIRVLVEAGANLDQPNPGKYLTRNTPVIPDGRAIYFHPAF